MKISWRHIAFNVMEKGQNSVRKYALEWRESGPGRGEHLNKHPGRIKDANLYPPW